MPAPCSTTPDTAAPVTQINSLTDPSQGTPAESANSHPPCPTSGRNERTAEFTCSRCQRRASGIAAARNLTSPAGRDEGSAGTAPTPQPAAPSPTSGASASSAQEQLDTPTSAHSSPATPESEARQTAGQAYKISGKRSRRYSDAVDIIQRNDLAAFKELGSASLKMCDGAGNNLVHTAVFCSVIPMEIVQQIVEWGHLDLANYLTRDTALHVAARAGDWRRCMLLIALGASTAAKNNINKTPHQLAATRGHHRLSEEIVASSAGEGSGCAAGSGEAATPTSPAPTTTTSEQRRHRHTITGTRQMKRSRSADSLLLRSKEAGAGPVEEGSAEETPLLRVVTTALRDHSKASESSKLATALLLALSQLKESRDREVTLSSKLYQATNERRSLAHEVQRVSAGSVVHEACLKQAQRDIKELTSEVTYNAAVSGTSSSFREAQATIARLEAEKEELTRRLQAANLRSVESRGEAARARRGRP